MRPHNEQPGYITERGNAVIYFAKKRDIDVDEKYAVRCATHGAVTGARCLAVARVYMQRPEDFCAGCRA
jgi:hypothetical protein